jgi:hypothetical protein
MYVCLKNRAKFFSFCLKRFSKRGKSRAFSEHNCPITSARDIRGKKICNGYTHFRREKSKEGRILQVLKRWVNINCTVKKG